MKVFLLLLLSTSSLLAQLSYKIDNSITVTVENGVELSQPWAGGLNAVQYNTIDLNQDGTLDLALFDRMANQVITYLNIDDHYIHHPEYQAFFPEQVTNLMLLLDYNCDGKKDIFTYHPLGISVYQNISTTDKLEWKLVMVYAGPGDKSEVILTKGFSGLINIKTQYDDLPAIVDADGDGDIDIFTVGFAGHGSIEYHKNFSVERYGTCDSLAFERQTQAWGNLIHCECGVFAFSGTDCPTGGRTKHAGGKSLLAIDANGDHKLDMLFSESSCNNLYLLPNDGTVDSPVINTSSTFPSDYPVDFEIFPGAYYEDVTFDGKKDLIVTPNIYDKEYEHTNLKNSNWLYINSGTNEHPQFTFQRKDFLQEEMIDVGDNSIPAFADLEGDGDLDLFISTNLLDKNYSYILLYENTGSPTEPKFRLKDDDYLGFSASGLKNLKIAFADIDHTTTQDLIFTGTDDNGDTDLYFFSNNNTSSIDLTLSFKKINFHVLPGENLSYIDIDHDNIIDILAGRSNGKLELWKNTLTSVFPNTPTFALADDDFLNMGSSIYTQNFSVSAGDLNMDGATDLVIGDQTGKLKVISNYEVSNEQFSDLVYNPVTLKNESPNLGGRSWPVIVNLFDTPKPAIVVGNVLGGIQVLKNESEFVLLPNPVQNGENLILQTDESLELTIYSSAGQRIGGAISVNADQTIAESVSRLASGLYIFRFTGKNKSFSRKIVIR